MDFIYFLLPFLIFLVLITGYYTSMSLKIIYPKEGYYIRAIAYTIIFSLAIFFYFCSFWDGFIFLLGNELSLNMFSEMTGLIITISVIETANSIIQNKNEKLANNLAIKGARNAMSVYVRTLAQMYSFGRNNLDLYSQSFFRPLQQFPSLQELFISNEFRDLMYLMNFNVAFGEIRYAEYANRSFKSASSQFLEIIQIYSSRLSETNIVLLSFIGVENQLFKVFAVMEFFSNLNYTAQIDDNEEEVTHPYINHFDIISHEVFLHHFTEVNNLIDKINDARSAGQEAIDMSTIANI